MRQWILGLALMVALGLPSLGWAHEGHTHKVLGTVSAIQGNQLTVRTTDNKTVIVNFDAKTPITRGSQRLTAAALKVGERVSIDAMEEASVNHAQKIQLGIAAPAASTSTARR